MLHSDKTTQSFLDTLRSRSLYAQDAPEQRFQRELTTGREIGASIAFWPTMNFEKSLLYREPLRDPAGEVLRSPDGNIQTFAPKDNAIAVAYRLGTNVLFKQYFAQYARAFSVAYNNNRDFRHTIEVGNDLLALSQSAQHLDNAPLPLVQEIRAAMQSPVQDMVSHSIAANRLLTRFADGEMETTPANIANLKRELDALATLAEEKAGSLRSMMAMRAFGGHTPDAMPEDLKEFSRPSGFIRDVLKQEKITSLRQSQILLAFAGGLMAEGTIPLSQEELFIPQEHVYVTGQQAIDMGRYISDSMRNKGYALNQDAKGQPLLSNLPTGAMVRTRHSANGDTAYVPLSDAEVAEFTTELLGYMKQHFGHSMEKLLAYADEHYADVQAILLGNPKKLRSYHDELKTALADSLPEASLAPAANTALSQPWQKRVEPHKSTLEQAAELPGKALHETQAMFKYLTRPEVKHEVSKLFSRGVPTYLLNFPVGLVSNMLLGFTKRDANWDHIPLTRSNWKKHGLGLVVTKDNIKAEMFQLMVYPLVESLGSVGIVEMARYPRMVALEASKHMDDVLLAAVKTAGEQDAAFKEGIEQLHASNPAAEVLEEHPEYHKVMQAIEGKPVLQTLEDYQLLAGFYHALSERVGKDAARVFSPFQNKDESFREVLHKVTHAPVATVSEAALALAFLRSITALNQKNITWLEYQPPEVAHMDHGQLGELSKFMNTQAELAGLTVFNPKIMKGAGITAGELVHRDLASGNCERAKPDDIIRLANIGTQKFREVMTIKSVEDVVSGRYSDHYIDATEKLLFGAAHFAPVAPDVQKAEEQQRTKNPVQQEPAKAWNISKVALPDKGNPVVEAAKYAVRPEAQHQMHKLFWRMLFSRMLYTPINISENLLWKHKIKIDRNAPMGTQVKQFFGSNNVKQAMWTLGSFPLVFSYGITSLWEFGSYMFGKQRIALEEGDASSQYLSAAIRAGAKADPDLNLHMSEQEGTNAAMLALQEKQEFKRLSEIFAKPEATRSEQEKALTQRFFEQAGDATIQHANNMFSGKVAEPDGVGRHLERLITQPATNTAEATRKLAFAESMIDMNREYTAMLRYFDPEEQLIDTKQLANLGTHIHKQAIGAGFVIYNETQPPKASVPPDVKNGELLQRSADGTLRHVSEENLVRFANVVGEKLVKSVEPKNLQKALHGKLAARYLDATDKNTSHAL